MRESKLVPGRNQFSHRRLSAASCFVHYEYSALVVSAE